MTIARDITPSDTYMRSQECVEDSMRWFGDVEGEVAVNVAHHTLALCGEVGELANLIKKVQRGSLDFHDAKVRHHIAQEMTDVYVYLLNLAGLLKIDLEKSYVLVRANNEQRFMEERRVREAKRARNAANG